MPKKKKFIETVPSDVIHDLDRYRAAFFIFVDDVKRKIDRDEKIPFEKLIEVATEYNRFMLFYDSFHRYYPQLKDKLNNPLVNLEIEERINNIPDYVSHPDQPLKPTKEEWETTIKTLRQLLADEYKSLREMKEECWHVVGFAEYCVAFYEIKEALSYMEYRMERQEWNIEKQKWSASIDCEENK